MAVLFSDDFEGGNLSNWDLVEGDSTVVSNPSGEGLVYRSAASFGDETDFGQITKNFALSTCFYYQYDVLATTAYLDAQLARANAGGPVHPAAAGDIWDSNPYEDGIFIESTTGTWPTLAGPFDILPALNPDTYTETVLIPDEWHTIRIEFDETTETFFVDGAQMATDLISEIGDPILAAFVLGSQLAAIAEPLYFDNFEVGTMPCAGGGPGPGIHAWQRL